MVKFNISETIPDLNIDKIKQILSRYLIKGSYLEKVELFPQIIKIDEASLSKMSTDNLALAYSLENLCDGELSLIELSQKIFDRTTVKYQNGMVSSLEMTIATEQLTGAQTGFISAMVDLLTAKLALDKSLGNL